MYREANNGPPLGNLGKWGKLGNLNGERNHEDNMATVKVNNVVSRMLTVTLLLV